MLGLGDDELANVLVPAHVDTRARLPARDPPRVQAQDRAKPSLRLARQLDLDRRRTPAGNDADEIRTCAPVAAILVRLSPRPATSDPRSARAARPSRARGRSARQRPTRTPPCGPTKSALVPARAARRLPRSGRRVSSRRTESPPRRSRDAVDPLLARQPGRVGLCCRHAHPIAHAHASIGAGPTLHSHRSPSRLAGPGPSRLFTFTSTH